EMPAETFMERVDRKFPFHVSRLAEILDGLQDDFFILEAVGDLVSPYATWYFDTDDMRFYNDHRRGLMNRVKVRYRSYPNSNTHFLEVKRKDKRSRTSKKRIPVEKLEWPFPPVSGAFLEANMTEVPVEALKPKVTIYYDRLVF